MNLDFELVEPTSEKIAKWGKMLACAPDEIIEDMIHSSGVGAAQQIIKHVESELKQNKKHAKSKTKVVSR